MDFGGLLSGTGEFLNAIEFGGHCFDPGVGT